MRGGNRWRQASMAHAPVNWSTTSIRIYIYICYIINCYGPYAYSMAFWPDLASVRLFRHESTTPIAMRHRYQYRGSACEVNFVNRPGISKRRSLGHMVREEERPTHPSASSRGLTIKWPIDRDMTRRWYLCLMNESMDGWMDGGVILCSLFATKEHVTFGPMCHSDLEPRYENYVCLPMLITQKTASNSVFLEDMSAFY